MSIREIANREGIEAGAGKNRVAKVVREAVGLRGKQLPAELEALGLELKTIPLGLNAYPYEAMSFPAFDPVELAEEEWEDSELCGRLQNMLMTPVFRARRDDDQMGQRVCKPFRWTPDRKQTNGIRAEWERYRDLFASGQIYDLPTSRETQFIHVRPHGRDRSDIVVVPGGRTIVRQSFWLNPTFVQELVRSHHSDWKGF
jgi:DNA mismatch repair endonuclease MutH